MPCARRELAKVLAGTEIETMDLRHNAFDIRAVERHCAALRRSTSFFRCERAAPLRRKMWRSVAIALPQSERAGAQRRAPRWGTWAMARLTSLARPRLVVAKAHGVGDVGHGAAHEFGTAEARRCQGTRWQWRAEDHSCRPTAQASVGAGIGCADSSKASSVYRACAGQHVSGHMQNRTARGRRHATAARHVAYPFRGGRVCSH